MIHYLLITIAILSGFYFVDLQIFRVAGGFAYIWLFICIASVVVDYVLKYVKRNNIIIHKSIILMTWIVGSIFLVSFIIVEGIIISHSVTKHKESPEYVIVLGAGVRGTKLSNTLYKRLVTAEKYLNEHQNTIAIVSGGQGPGENISEADAMYNYLVEKGIDKNRVIKEDISTNTFENINNSFEIIREKSGCEEISNVAILTSNFHVFRAVKLAEKAGATNVKGVSAPIHFVVVVNYYVREYFAVVKYILSGEI